MFPMQGPGSQLRVCTLQLRHCTAKTKRNSDLIFNMVSINSYNSHNKKKLFEVLNNFLVLRVPGTKKIENTETGAYYNHFIVC